MVVVVEAEQQHPESELEEQEELPVMAAGAGRSAAIEVGVCEPQAHNVHLHSMVYGCQCPPYWPMRHSCVLAQLYHWVTALMAATLTSATLTTSFRLMLHPIPLHH